MRGGEIDIIAEKNGTVAFVEVKTRKKGSLTEGEEAVNSAKKRHIIRTAEIYMEKNMKTNEYRNCRFDVATVQVSDKKVTHLRYYVNAFDASK